MAWLLALPLQAALSLFREEKEKTAPMGSDQKIVGLFLNHNLDPHSFSIQLQQREFAAYCIVGIGVVLRFVLS